jgi:hypothetical protein
MSVLPAGQPLARFLPDLDDLLHDPAAYLREAPVSVGPRKMYGLAALFGLAGAALLLSCAVTGWADGERVALGIGLLLGASVWLGWSLRMRGHEMVLHPDGVEVKYRDTAVWCPWAVFNVEGKPFVPDADSPRVGLTLPVAPEAVPFVELRRHEAPVAHGAQVRAPQWQFTAADEVMLPARYEVVAGELGDLLLQLGRRLGRNLPRGAPPPEAYRVETLDEVPAAPDRSGWITAYLTRLSFPPRCCDCGTATDEALRFHVEARGDWLLGQLTQTRRAVELTIPVCAECQEAIRWRQQRGGSLGTGLGATALLTATLALAFRGGLGGTDFLLVLGVTAVAVGGLAGFLLGTTLARRLPVRFRGYSPGRGTLSLRFRNPDYAALVLDAMRARTLRR